MGGGDILPCAGGSTEEEHSIAAVEVVVPDLEEGSHMEKKRVEDSEVDREEDHSTRLGLEEGRAKHRRDSLEEEEDRQEERNRAAAVGNGGAPGE